MVSDSICSLIHSLCFAKKPFALLPTAVFSAVTPGTSAVAVICASSRTLPVELVPIVVLALTPPSKVGICLKKPAVGIGCLLDVASTVRSVPTFAKPSSQALVLPLSTLMVKATAALPSVGAMAWARVRLRSMFSAIRNIAPPLVSLADPVTCALDSVDITLTATAPA